MENGLQAVVDGITLLTCQQDESFPLPCTVKWSHGAPNTKRGAAQNIKMAAQAASPSARFFRALPASSFQSTLDEKYQKPNKSVGPEVGHYIELKNE